MQRDPLAILLAVGVAIYVAVVADTLARDEFGLSSREVPRCLRRFLPPMPW